MKIKCKNYNELLTALIAGNFTNKEKTKVISHGRTCLPCSTKLESYMKMENQLNLIFSDVLDLNKLPQVRVELDERLNELFSATIFYSIMQTGVVGKLFVAISEEGICRVSFSKSENLFLDGLQKRSDRIVKDTDKLQPVMRELDEYFSGKRKRFDFPIDLSLATSFQKQVLKAAAGIPFGKVSSYGEIAREIGNPNASRAVGNALGKNPVPIIIPCHRVIACDGSLGGYTGGIQYKKRLMKVEGIRLSK